ncbi:hypothetical protein KAR91_59830 [Candidatus Pacearchaeota archaeon]|nr:hypothetical protein [Candidatus Pacearchaeota archaeon]
MENLNNQSYWNDAKQVDVNEPSYWNDAKVLDAPNNTVFDNENNRTLSLPQTLNADETSFVIKRDVEEIKEFFGQEDVGGFEALGMGVKAFFASTPQALGGEFKAYGEITGQPLPEISEQTKSDIAIARRGVDFFASFFGVKDASKKIQANLDATVFNDKAFVAAGDKLIAKNKKYMADAGLTGEGLEGANKVLFDIGSGGSSMLSSLGMFALTRTAATAGLFFGALQHSSIYQEAREEGKTPEEAQAIALPAGIAESALEFVGLDRFIKALKGNSAVKRFITGFGIEATQEASQTAAEEIITQTGGLREDKTLLQTAQDILYSGFLGGVIGGGSNAVVGTFVRDSAEVAGIDKSTAKNLGKYAENNIDAAKTNMSEFIEKELAPIAKDDKSAQEFITLMQDFGNNKNIVERDSLDPETREIFDQYVEIFNQSVVDKSGVAAVEKTFYEQAVAAGVGQEEAVASGKLMGARADAASRALGVTPQEWYESYNLRVSKELGEDKRGSITFKENETVIKLFEKADKSTLLHESGHFFLRDMQTVSGKTKKPRVKKDLEIVEKWLGVKNHKFTVEQEEKFARGFEAYLREGEAPKPELQGVFDRFREWLKAIYTSAKKLNVKISPDAREVFDRMLGGDFVQTEQAIRLEEEQKIRADYEEVALMEDEGSLKGDALIVGKDFVEWGGDAFIPISTRLKKMDVKIMHFVRRFVFDLGVNNREDNLKIKPFIEKVSKEMSIEDYKVFDLALKNRDIREVDTLVEKYGLEEDWKSVRELLDKIFIEAMDVGLDMNFLEEYFPRQVKFNMAGEYLAAMRGQEAWSEIELALHEADPNMAFSIDEQAEFVNKFLRGFSSKQISLGKPSFTKDRTVDYVTPEFNKYYNGSIQTLISYVSGMRHAIESRKLFGHSEKETDTNIGKYVLGLVKDGIITHKEEITLKKILKAVVEPSGTRGWVGWSKNAAYIYTMGNPISALTQVQDLAFSLHKNGYWRSGKSLLKSLTGRQILKKEDIGLEHMLEEFKDNSRSSVYVRKTFQVTGLTFMDNVGKEVFIDAAYSRIRKANKKGSAAFKEEMKGVFGNEADQVMQDITDGRMTENVKYLLFSELSDIQPISLAEMPVYYLNQGNGRILYMLKTYTMKQFDIYRREIFDNLASGNVKTTAKGLKNLISLASALMVMGMSTDAMKDFILGREITLDDLVIDNILKVMGVSKYLIYKSRVEGIGNTIFRFITPPILSPIDDLRDVPKIAVGEKSLKDARILQRIPVIGKFYYWWWGEGSEKK